MRRASLPVSLAALGLVLLALGIPAPSVRAADILQNGDFETWPAPGWTPGPGTAPTLVTSPSKSGSSLQLTTAGGAASLSKKVSASGSATYAANVFVQPGTSAAAASLTLKFYDDGLVELAALPGAPVALANATFVSVSTTATAPSGTAFVEFRVNINPGPNGPMTAYVDSASLIETLPPPTATPTSIPDTPTPTATSTLDTATPTATFSTEPSPSTSPIAGTPTKTHTPTKTPTETRTPKPANTPTPTKIPKATATPTPTRSGPTPTPTRPPGIEAFGGLIQNGNFEWLDGTRPAVWAKFGGEMSVAGDAYRGDWSGVLSSETASTKWLYQVAPIDGGAWYAADGFARIIRGGGDAFIRVSWYAAEDGSGSSLDDNDSPVGSSSAWASLSTGPVQAPESANSARVRLMLRPSNAAAVQASFDDITLQAVEAPPPSPTPSPNSAATPAASAVAGARSSPNPGEATGGNGTPMPSGIPSVAGPGSLRLSEVLSDPEEPGRDSPFEWVEIVNAGAEPLDTVGWRIGDGKEFDTLPSLVLAPGEYAVVAGRSVQLPASVRILLAPDGEIGGGLNNAGDAIRLVAPDGSEADALSFGDNKTVYDPAPPAPGPGHTLGARLPAADPAAENWALTEEPTPGEANVFPAAQTAPKQATATPAGAAAPLRDASRTGDGSTVPWIVLGGALGAGSLGGFSLARKSAPTLKRRFRRGR
jgi:hypothetical protein